MIHFQCSCGRTLSAPETARGEDVPCDACGRDVSVPGGTVGAAAVVPARPRRAAHDFDAEIVTASRSRPPRPVKTPFAVEGAETGEEDLPPVDRDPPAHDLELVRQAPRLVGIASWLALALLVASAVAVFLLWPVSLKLRCVGAITLLVLAGGLFVGLQVLKEVARAVSGLADQQRGILALLEDDED